MLKFKAVSHRLIFWILGASASLFLLISYYEHITAEHFLREQMRSKANLVKLDMVNRIENLLYKVSDSARTAAAVLPIEDTDLETIKTLLENIVRKQGDIYGMAVALEPNWTRGSAKGFAPYFYHEGPNIAYADLASESYDYRAQQWYRQATQSGHAVWSEPYYDEGGGNIAMVTYSVPIYGGEYRNTLIGVVTADIALSSFATMVSELALGQVGFAYIFTHEGNIITHSNNNMIMGNLAQSAVPGGDNREYLSVIKGMQEGKTDTLHLGCERSKTGECWLSYQPIAGTNWSMAIVIPMDELLASLMEYRYKSLAITLVGLIFLAVIVVLASRRLTIPLLALAESTRALGRGELDTNIDDYNLKDEIGTLAHHFQRMQQALKDYIEQLKQQTAHRERLEGELGAAHDIQMQMLPDKGSSNVLNPRWQLSAVLLPAKSVGGDLYHYQMLNEQQLFFAVGDVSDKGVAAALFMAKTQTLLRQLCSTTPDLGKLLELINLQLSQDNSSCMFVTLLVGVLDTNTGDLRVASAGHASPLLLKETCQFTDIATGPALGFFEHAEFTSSQMTLAPNCPLILSTDGVDEASNTAQEHYGEQRLQELINNAHTLDTKELLDNVLSDVVEFRADAEPSDDLTIMIITRL